MRLTEQLQQSNASLSLLKILGAAACEHNKAFGRHPAQSQILAAAMRLRLDVLRLKPASSSSPL
jgi:hypothetical protein